MPLLIFSKGPCARHHRALPVAGHGPPEDLLLFRFAQSHGQQTCRRQSLAHCAGFSPAAERHLFGGGALGVGDPWPQSI
jgi:hypothetical protein